MFNYTQNWVMLRYTAAKQLLLLWRIAVRPVEYKFGFLCCCFSFSFYFHPKPSNLNKYFVILTVYVLSCIKSSKLRKLNGKIKCKKNKSNHWVVHTHMYACVQCDCHMISVNEGSWVYNNTKQGEPLGNRRIKTNEISTLVV